MKYYTGLLTSVKYNKAKIFIHGTTYIAKDISQLPEAISCTVLVNQCSF
jgi:hypothetical protein